MNTRTRSAWRQLFEGAWLDVEHERAHPVSNVIPGIDCELYADERCGRHAHVGSSGQPRDRSSQCRFVADDQRGRLFVADRENNRIQIFNQEGEHLASWTQFGRPSGVSFDEHGRIYVADSESDDVQNPGWEMGLRIGDAATGWVRYFVRFPWGDPRSTRGSGAEFVAADGAGNLYAGEPFRRILQKYVRVMP